MPAAESLHPLVPGLNSLHCSAHESGDFQTFGLKLRELVSRQPEAVQQYHRLLTSSGCEQQWRDSLDETLGLLSAQEEKRPQSDFRWCTLALQGTLSYAGQDCLSKVDSCAALREWLATTLSLDLREVSVGGLVMSAEGAYALTPSEGLAVSQLWRNAQTDPRYASLSEVASNHRLADGGEQQTCLQVVHLVHVMLPWTESPVDVVREVQAAIDDELPTWDYAFSHDEHHKTVAQFSPWACRLPWSAFKSDLYRDESMYVMALCSYFAKKRGLKRTELSIALNTVRDEEGGTEVIVKLGSPMCGVVHKTKFGKMMEPALLIARIQADADEARVTVRLAIESFSESVAAIPG